MEHLEHLEPTFRTFPIPTRISESLVNEFQLFQVFQNDDRTIMTTELARLRFAIAVFTVTWLQPSEAKRLAS
jgi:hypothetical protein